MSPEIANILQDISDITEQLSMDDRERLGRLLMKYSAAILVLTDEERRLLIRGQVDEQRI